MSRLNMLVIQDVKPKEKGEWRDTVGPEAFNAIWLFMIFLKRLKLTEQEN